MDRYTLAILSRDKIGSKKAFHFSTTNEIKKVMQYITYCLIRGGIFIANNIPERVLNNAIIKYCKKYKYIIIMESEEKVIELSIPYSYKYIYATTDNIPKKRNIIYYNCPDKKLSESENVIVIQSK